MKIRAIRLAVTFLVTALWILFIWLFGDIFELMGVMSISILGGMLNMYVADESLSGILITIMMFLIPLVESILPVWLITFIHTEAKRKEYMDKSEFIELQIFFIATNIIAMYAILYAKHFA